VSDFPTRCEKHTAAEEKLIKFMEENSIEYAFSGYETLKQSENFKEIIQSLPDETAKRIRFFPDFMLAKKTAWLIDIKSSKTIEKDAYDAYYKLYEIGYNVGLVFYNPEVFGEVLAFTDIKDLIIYKKEPADFDGVYDGITILEKKWVAPRVFTGKWTKEKYEVWKSKRYTGSGTTYGYIDLNLTNFKSLKIASDDADTPSDANNADEYGQLRIKAV